MGLSWRREYRGLLTENDLTKEALERGDEVRAWIGKAHAALGQDSEPEIRTGGHCSNPFECSFWSYCRSQEPQAEYPVEWLPRLHRLWNFFVGRDDGGHFG